MVGQKLFKTRMCLLYKKGNCHRQNCSFAHGDAELRRYNTSSSSFNGRQDYRGADLRDKLGRQQSPIRKNSFDRDTRDRFTSHGHDSPRFGKKNDWGHRETKPSSSDVKDIHDNQLKNVQTELDMLEDHKHQLQIYLEERSQEADSLNSKIEELEMQLSNEKEECRRISSKIKKFVKANHRHSRIQDELKRSQARVERLGEQLGYDARAAANEEDISINILSDEENLMGNDLITPKYDNSSPRKDRVVGPLKDEYKDSPNKKRMRAHMEEDTDEKWGSGGNMRSERHSRWDPHLGQTKNDEINEVRNVRGFVNYEKSSRRKGNFTSFPLGDKIKEQKSTRMSTTFVDEVIEEVDFNENSSSGRVENTTVLPPPPPLPAGQNTYLQYKEKDENVVDDGDDDVDVDEDEMLDVDIV